MGRKQRVLQPATPIEHPFVEINRRRNEYGKPFGEAADDMVLDEFARPFARRFLVSPTAMRIRLEKLGLLLRTEPKQHLMKGIL